MTEELLAARMRQFEQRDEDIERAAILLRTERERAKVKNDEGVRVRTTPLELSLIHI